MIDSILLVLWLIAPTTQHILYLLYHVMVDSTNILPMIAPTTQPILTMLWLIARRALVILTVILHVTVDSTKDE